MRNADAEAGDGRNVVNPYANNAGAPLPQYHPLNVLKRIAYIGISAYFLHHMKFYRAIMVSPTINHEAFKFGLGTTIAIISIKAYVETYEGRIKKIKVNYENFPKTTHWTIFLILLSTLAYYIALWPMYGWNTPILLGVCFFGIILNFTLLVPSYVQNICFFVALTFFLQQYK